MPPKKKKVVKEEVEEYLGPNIYEEIRNKPITEIEVNLLQPVPRLNVENMEFESLVEKIQDDIVRLVADNKRLQAKDEITKKTIVKQGDNRVAAQKRSLLEREAATVLKDDLRENHKSEI